MLNSWSQKAAGRLDQLLHSEEVSSSLPSGQLTASTLRRPPLASPQSHAPKDATIEYLSALERRALHLQRQLQGLLDDHAELLAPRIEKNRETYASESQSMTSSGVMPIRQPRKNRPSLPRTRENFSRLMLELSDLKLEEQEVLNVVLDERKNKAQQAQKYRERRAKLQNEIDSIHDGKESRRVQTLREEGDAVQSQINSMELQLEDLRSKRRAISMELSRLENTVQSKLSSYTGSLKLLDSKIERALAEVPSAMTTSVPSVFLTLAKHRRTLEMMAEHMNDEEALLKSRQDGAKMEQEALEAGAAIWEEIVSEITFFEGRLKHEIMRLSQPAGHLNNETEDRPSGDQSVDGLVDQLERVAQSLQVKLEEAETNSWNLLVCAIGAELEALRQGREILESLRPRRSSSRSHSPDHESNGDTDAQQRSSQQLASRSARRRRRSSDDEPDPDLLLSKQQDTDTDYESSI